MALLDLDPDQLLSTTRAVRKRLDFTRDVPDELIRECVALAFQSPSGSNNPTMHFVIVRDEAKRRAIGEVYRQCFTTYRASTASTSARSTSTTRPPTRCSSARPARPTTWVSTWATSRSS